MVIKIWIINSQIVVTETVAEENISPPNADIHNITANDNTRRIYVHTYLLL